MKNNRYTSGRQYGKTNRRALLQKLHARDREILSLKEELQEALHLAGAREVRMNQCRLLADASLEMFRLLESSRKTADFYMETISQLAAESCGQSAGEEPVVWREEN